MKAQEYAQMNFYLKITSALLICIIQGICKEDALLSYECKIYLMSKTLQSHSQAIQALTLKHDIKQILKLRAIIILKSYLASDSNVFAIKLKCYFLLAGLQTFLEMNEKQKIDGNSFSW